MRDTSRPGRWRTGEESRRRILESARRCFSERGYDRTTIRAIAARAKVDPSMVHYFFGNKARLFAVAMKFPLDIPERLTEQLAGGVDGLGDRLARHFISVWDEQSGIDPLLALMRSAPTDDRLATMFAEFVEGEIVTRLRTAIGGDEADLRAELIGSQLIGFALMRYVLRIEPLASASPDAVARRLGPALQYYLTGAA